jgi:hypothetical protein
MGIFPVNSKLPLINADMVAANTIEALHIQTNAIESRHIKSDAITASKVLNVGSSETAGARIKMTHTYFRVYNSSSTSDDNYYPIEINTRVSYIYTRDFPPNPFI